VPYSNQELLEHIEELAEADGEPPSCNDLRRADGPVPATYYSRWDSWDDVIEAAGLERDTGEPTPDRVSKPELEAALNALMEDLGYAPRPVDVTRHGEYSRTTYRRRYGSLRAAFIEAVVPTYNWGYTVPRERLVTAIQQVGERLERTPRIEEVVEAGQYTADTYRRRFGDFAQAVEAAGFSSDEVGHQCRRPELLAELERLADLLDKPPSKLDMRYHGEYWPGAYLRRWEDWEAALNEVGLKSAAQRRAERMRIPESRLEAELRRVATVVECRPSASDIAEYADHSPTTYFDRYGDLDSAYAAASVPETVDDEWA